MKKLRVTVGNQTYDVTVEVLEDDRAAAVPVALPAESVPAASPPPVANAVENPTPQAAPLAAGAIASPMAGTVKSVEVKLGDTVTEGQVLVVLDAMKMENRVVASRAGSVKEIAVQPGDTVGEGQPLLVIE